MSIEKPIIGVYHKKSIFYVKAHEEAALSDVNELGVVAQVYSPTEHREAINIAITRLKLLKLSDQLASMGFHRFDRFIDPITKQLSPNNVVETELLPTIAMLLLQQDEFVEFPMTAELKAMSADRSKVQKLIGKCQNDSVVLREYIGKEIVGMDQSALQTLISESQHNLFGKLYKDSREDLDQEARQVLVRRETVIPAHVVACRQSFFSNSTESPQVNMGEIIFGVGRRYGG